MKALYFSREQLSILIYALVASKEQVDPSQHAEIDNLISILNK
jgi:hypothetical protein